jgi:SAM-dependent methyltransferase
MVAFGGRFHGWEDLSLDGRVDNVAGAAGRGDASLGVQVTLADGSVLPLAGLSRQDLLTLQWQQEQQFAARILAAPKGSPDRAEVLRHAYDTVTQLFAAAQGFLDEPVRMGLHPRHERLVLETLQRQRRRKMEPRFFEIGYASGVLLDRVARAGFPIAGIEVSEAMRRQALKRLGPDHASRLYLGDFLRAEILQTAGPFTLVYWNDVFEHVPPDEILDYLRRIHELLVPGGQLITITPNWHVRPSDITRVFQPARTAAAGVHLKEYTLREVTSLLRQAGFARVATPLVVLPRRMVLCGTGLAGLKRAAERGLEALPYALARLFCRGAALSTTIATKDRTRHAPRDADPHAEREEYLSPSLVEVLRCPACRGLLEWTVEGCRCAGEGCRSEFPRSGGVPLLIHEAQSVFSIAAFLNREPTFFKPVSPWRAWLSRRLPDLSHNLAARRVLGRMRDRLLQRSRRPRVLVIGAGEVGVGLETLLEEPAIEMVEVDASLGPRVQVVCDAHDLPLADGAFDGVVIQAVLEHVLDPVRCVAEIHRVLKPGGLVYADTPQVCQVHGREFDFTRYTRLGHRRLFRHFGELESGISSGPAMALGWTVRYFLLSISSRPLVRAAISGFSRLTLFWLKYLDYLLLAKPAAMDAAFAFYFLGEKRDEILHDRDLVRSYRGGF